MAIGGDEDRSPSLPQAMQIFAAMICIVESLATKVDRLSEQIEKLDARTHSPRTADTSNRATKEFYSVKQVAEIIGTSDKTVRRLQKRGFFKSSKALRTKQIPRSEIDRYKMETV